MRQLFTALAVSLVVATASAVPARRGIWKTLRTTDNSEVRAELRGDEFCHYWQAANGKVYVQRDTTETYVETTLEALQNASEAKRNAVRKARATRSQNVSRKNERVSSYSGTRKGLIILANFTDVKFSGDNALYQRIANEKNFSSEDGFTGSVRDYFLAQSEGILDLQFDVVGPVQLVNRYRYYGRDNGGEGNDSHLGQFIADACELADTCTLADGSKVNFADYDWDGDGEVDQVFVLYAGQGQAAGGDANTIWPQEGVLSSPLSDHSTITLDGVTIDTYACSCELGVNKTIDGIGTICHEFSHCFGLPDMYDTSTNTNYGMCIWSVMDYGNYMNDSFTPSCFTAYERMACGWKQPVVLERDTVVASMAPLANGGDTYIIYNDADHDEYYLLENRQQTGWDAGLFGSGLLITHVTYNEEIWNSNKVNSYSPQRCTVIPADNSLKKWPVSDNHDDIAADLYPYNGNNSLTNTTTPAASLNNENTDGSLLMNKQITDITQNADGTIAFRFVASNSDGINDVTTVRKKASNIYSLDGRNLGDDMSRLAKGIYIMDGKTVVKTVISH